MPYLYTTAEETSHNGVPIVRPLFVEFPHAAADHHPIDLDTSGEFLFGRSILVADSPSPEEVSPYEVHLPPGIWYDYWTGERLDRRAPVTTRDLEIREAVDQDLKPVMVNPGPADLPVYVREGTILPIAPLVQSTDEKPVGALTLRVFPGQDCQGSVYLDDGKSFDFRKGSYLRQHFTCRVAADGSVTVNVSAREGIYPAWWTNLRVEVVGFSSTSPKVSVEGHNANVVHTKLGWAATIEDNGHPQSILFR
jgi:alpha-glucosidase